MCIALALPRFVTVFPPLVVLIASVVLICQSLWINMSVKCKKESRKFGTTRGTDKILNLGQCSNAASAWRGCLLRPVLHAE